LKDRPLLFPTRRGTMKMHRPSCTAILILCTAFLLAGCNGDVELSPEVIELDEPLTFGTVDLEITHYIPMGIGEIVVEATIPLEFPVKRGILPEREISWGYPRP
jgi:hypothetical protein